MVIAVRRRYPARGAQVIQRRRQHAARPRILPADRGFHPGVLQDVPDGVADLFPRSLGEEFRVPHVGRLVYEEAPRHLLEVAVSRDGRQPYCVAVGAGVHARTDDDIYPELAAQRLGDNRESAFDFHKPSKRPPLAGRRFPRHPASGDSEPESGLGLFGLIFFRFFFFRRTLGVGGFRRVLALRTFVQFRLERVGDFIFRPFE